MCASVLSLVLYAYTQPLKQDLSVHLARERGLWIAPSAVLAGTWLGSAVLERSHQCPHLLGVRRWAALANMGAAVPRLPLAWVSPASDEEDALGPVLYLRTSAQPLGTCWPVLNPGV